MRATLFYLIFIFSFLGCGPEKVNTPKPKGYFKINFPKKNYRQFNNKSPYTFDYPAYAKMQTDTNKNAQAFWYNLNFTQFNGTLHLTYYDVRDRKKFESMTEAARDLAFKHTVKATAIDQQYIYYPKNKVYGTYYAISGNTASSVQFFLTDSAKHYFRGALYFYEQPQYDSIQPVVKFIKKDIDRMIATFKWKN